MYPMHQYAIAYHLYFRNQIRICRMILAKLKGICLLCNVAMTHGYNKHQLLLFIYFIISTAALGGTNV
jgi:hypothetical protein